MSHKCWLPWFLVLGLAWTEPVSQGQVRVSFDSNQPVKSVELLGEQFFPDEAGRFLLPLGAGGSNFGPLTLTVVSASGETSQIEAQRMRESEATLEVKFKTRTPPLGTLVLLSAVGLGLMYWRWNQSKGGTIQALQAQEEAQADLAEAIKVVGRYRVLGLLGQGGMATVYKAVAEGSQQAVALKVISAEAADEAESRHRFEREIQVSLKLEHPNVVRVLDWGIAETGLFLALECIEGTTLREKIPPQGLPLAKAMNYILPICDALEYAHGQGVVHRDLKPENVMVTPSDKVKLMDFGLARSHQVSTLTMTGQALGSPHYMAPEQVTDKQSKDTLNPRSDQYSLAILIYELVSGHPPFQGQTIIEVIMQQIQATPKPLGEQVADLPPAFEAAVMRALSKDPADRFASIADLRTALVAALP